MIELMNMGFYDFDKNLKLLQENDNKMDEVLDKIMEDEETAAAAKNQKDGSSKVGHSQKSYGNQYPPNSYMPRKDTHGNMFEEMGENLSDNENGRHMMEVKEASDEVERKEQNEDDKNMEEEQEASLIIKNYQLILFEGQRQFRSISFVKF